MTQANLTRNDDPPALDAGRRGLWSDQWHDAPTASWIERPHRDGPYADRARDPALLHLLHRLPQGFLTPDPGRLDENVFAYRLPPGHRIGRMLPEQAPDRLLGAAARALAALHARPAVAEPRLVPFRPPVVAVMAMLAGGRGDRAVVQALPVLRDRLRRSSRSLSEDATVPCHGRWSLGSMTAPANNAPLLVLTGPDLCFGPAAFDLGYLGGELLEAMVAAKLARRPDVFRARLADFHAMVEAYRSCHPLDLASMLDFAAARLAAHLACNQALRLRLRHAPPIAPAEAAIITAEAAAILALIEESLRAGAQPRMEAGPT